ncbi:MAG: phosphoenolpyruvate synthase [archaeon]
MLSEIDDLEFVPKDKKLVLWFREIRKDNLELAGGKGANLGEMTNEGFPVPSGFIVSSKSFDLFLEKNQLNERIQNILKQINYSEVKDLQERTEEIRELIKETPIPVKIVSEIKKAYERLGEKKLAWLTSSEECFVAVRSSATAEDLPTASFAGQQDTYLNIKGKENVVNAVRNCWASLYTARATYYRLKQGFTGHVSIAVVIQKMVNSKVSGIMFTANPTGDQSKLIIEAVYGLGEAIVGGAVTPDHYVIDKKSIRIESKQIAEQEWKLERKEGRTVKSEVSKKEGEKQKLEDKLILNLAKIGRQIEAHYKMPQDIEWAIENNELFITQSRAITTLKKGIEAKEKIDSLQHEKEVILTGLAASPGIAGGKVKIVHNATELSKIEKGDILVTAMTTPDMVVAMEKAGAIITNSGGSTCHASIVSRELGIPCVVGTKNATKVLIENQEVTVDAVHGKVFDGIIEELIEKKLVPGKETEKTDLSTEAIEQKFHLNETELNQVMEKISKPKILVKVNVALPEAAERAFKTQPDGVGLLRAEHMFTKTGKHPYYLARQGKTDELVELIKKEVTLVVKWFKDKPVWYRTFDARTDEFANLEGGNEEPKEDNPMLGWHGIRRAIDKPTLIKAEFKAIKELRSQGYKKLGVMLPFVQSVEELKQAKEIAKEVGLMQDSEFEFGVMIETPASIWIIDELIAEGINFVSFGTNDLTQLTLGVDRNNELIQKLFNELHPAVLREIEFVISKCLKAGVKTSICGQAASNPAMVEKLINFGINSVSANIDSVEKIRETVKKLEMLKAVKELKNKE